MAAIIDGKQVAETLRNEVATRVAAFERAHGRRPGLHVILVGEDPASAVYVRNKEKAAEAAGLVGKVHRLPATATQAQLMTLLKELNAAADVDGILVQLPLPSGLKESEVLETISPEKDVDGFHAVNVGALWSGGRALVPCTPRGCVYLLEKSGVQIAGKRAIVIGRSNLVGKPVAALLLARHATVTLAHSRTEDLPARTAEADIVIAAVGRAKLVKRSWIKPGAVVIDVGINRDEAGKLCGDVDFEDVKDVAGQITPVPGGVGPMTIAMLLDNTLSAAIARVG